MLVVFVSGLFVLYILFIFFAYYTSQENYEYESSRRRNKEDGWAIFGIFDFASNQEGILLPSLSSTQREHQSFFLIEYFTHISLIEKLLFIVQTFDFIFDLLFWINIHEDFKAVTQIFWYHNLKKHLNFSSFRYLLPYFPTQQPYTP